MDYIAQIIPIRRLKRRLDYFDYLIPKEMLKTLKVGHIVKAPFRKQTVFGMVFNIKELTQKPRYPLKEISEVLHPSFYFPKETVSLIQQTADYNLVSWATMAYFALPEFPKRKLKNEILAPVQKEKNAQPKISLLQTLSIQEEIQLITKHVALLEGSTMLLTPSFKKALLLKERLETQFKNKIVLIHSQFNKSQSLNSFIKCLEGNKLIIGTKLALFAPCHDIRNIILTDYSSEDYKQTDQNPRYDGRFCAKKLSELYSCPLYLLGETPQVEDSGKKYPFLESNTKKIKPEIIDLNQQLQVQNFTPLSLPLEEALNNSLANHKRVFLFVNKTGFSSSIECSDCDYQFTCPICKKLLKAKQNNFFCTECKKELPAHNRCPKCHGSNLKFSGLGIEKVFQFLRAKYPNHSIIQIGSHLNPKELPDILNYQIVLGTKFALHHYKKELLQNFGIVGIISMDSVFFFPSFNSNQKILNRLFKLYNIANSNACPFFVQTHFYYHPAMEALQTLHFNKFTQSDLQERQMFSYPPFSKIILLTYKDVSRQKTQNEGQSLMNRLSEEFRGEEVQLSGPFETETKAKTPQTLILVKITKPQALSSFLKYLKLHLHEEWLIDIDPIKIPKIS